MTLHFHIVFPCMSSPSIAWIHTRDSQGVNYASTFSSRTSARCHNLLDIFTQNSIERLNFNLSSMVTSLVKRNNLTSFEYLRRSRVIKTLKSPLQLRLLGHLIGSHGPPSPMQCHDLRAEIKCCNSDCCDIL